MPFKILLAAAVCLAALDARGALAAAPPRSVSEVVVTGTPYAVSLDSATTSIDVVTRKDLALAPPLGLGDVLEGLPGLRSTFYGPGASRPVIRGQSGPRVLVLENGVGLVDASTLSPDHAVASEPGEASRIEVLRGPSTLAYGGSAIGGVVNILDDRIPSSPARGGLEGHVAASLGSVDDSASTSAAVKAGQGPWVIAIDGVKRRSDDYAVPVDPVSARLAALDGVTPLDDRIQRNTGVRLEAYGAGASYVGDSGFVGASVKRTTSLYGVPYAQVQRATAPEEGPVRIDLKQTRYDVRGETTVGIGPFDKARFSIGYADYSHAELDAATGEVGTRFLSSGAEGRIELVQAEREGWKGAAGVQGLKRRFDAIGDEAFVPKVEIEEGGAFTLQRLDRGAWGVEGGVRIDRRRLDANLAGRPTSAAAQALGLAWSTAGRDPVFTNLSASGAAFIRPARGWFASLALSRNSRAPTEFELFADGPHPGTGAYEIGDPTLKAERAVSMEATLRWTGARGRLEAHAYASRYRGFIDEVRDGRRVDDDGAPAAEGDLPVSRFVQVDARFHGGELEGAYDLWRDGARRLSLEGAFDIVRGETDDGPAARIPPYSILGRILWRDERLQAQVEVRHVGRQDRVRAFELPTDAYTLVAAQVSYAVLSKPDVRVFVDGRNLTDQEAREHASFLKDIAPLPGRTIRAGFYADF